MASRSGATAATTSPGAWRRTLAVAAATAVMVGAGAFFAGRLTVPEPERLVGKFPMEVAEGLVGVSHCCGPEEALSPDGRWLVYHGQRSSGGRESLYRRDFGQLTSEVIPGTEGALTPFFSPDGLWVGFWADGHLRKVPMAGGPSIPIVETSVPDGADWGDDDTIVYALNGVLYKVSAAGGRATPVPLTDSTHSYGVPSFLPGARAVLALLRSAKPARLAVVDLATGSADTVADATRGVYASGYLVMSGADGTLLAQPFDPVKRATRGQALALLDGVHVSGPRKIGEFAVARNTGTLIVLDPAPGEAEALMIQGKTLQHVPLPESGHLSEPAFSPDGRRIALQIAPKNERNGIWVWDRDQRGQQLLMAEALSPVWTRDGKRISYTSIAAGGRVQPYWIPADGSGPAKRLFPKTLGVSAFVESWTRDGRAVVQVNRGRTSDIGLVTPGDTAVQWLVKTDADEWQGQVSPDGRWLAYTSDRSGHEEVYAQALDGSGARVPISSGGGASPRWAPDSRTLYYAEAQNQPLTVVSLSTDGGLKVAGRTRESHGFVGVGAVTDYVDYDVSPRDGAVVYIAADSTAAKVRPTFTWVLNWPEIVRGTGGAR